MAVMANPHIGPLAGGGAVGAAPHLVPQLDVPQRHGGFLAVAIDVALVHRPRHIGQGGGIAVGLLFPVPALQQADPHLARIKVQGKDVLVRQVAKGLARGAGLLLQAVGRGPRWQGRCNRHQGHQGAHGDGDRQPAFALVVGSLPAMGPGLGTLQELTTRGSRWTPTLVVGGASRQGRRWAWPRSDTPPTR